MADNLVRRWIMAEWTFQKLHQIIYILRSAKNFNPKWLKASGRAVGFRVRCHTTADKHGPWPLRYRMAVCTTRPACQQCLSTYEKKKKRHPVTTAGNTNSVVRCPSPTPPPNSAMHSLAQIHMCTQWCKYTELVKPLHTVCYFWFRNGVRVQ